MSSIDVKSISPILKDITDKKTMTEKNKRFSRIRAAIGKKAKNKSSK